MPLQADSFWVSVDDQQLHVRYYGSAHPNTSMTTPAILMLHGSVGSGRIFYSRSDKGLGPWLARQGFEVYIPDLSGRGQSLPPVGPESHETQTDQIHRQIPALIDAIAERHGDDCVLQAVSHSWGGVLLSAYLAKAVAGALPLPSLAIQSMVFLGTKRAVSWRNPWRLIPLDLLWGLYGELQTRWKGYLPSKQLGFGSDNEPAGVYRGCKAWVYSGRRWRDPIDGFDYANALKHLRKSSVRFPPTLLLSGSADRYLGHPQDVETFSQELQSPSAVHLRLGKQYGNALDYDHVTLCTAPEAQSDHFPLIADWLRGKRSRFPISPITPIIPTVDYRAQS